jgi:phosphohistidine phosphatase
MKEIVLVRHSNADDAGFNVSDFDRQLNEKGIAKAEKIAGMCASYYLGKKAVFISSPAPRAIQTAEIFARVLSYPADKIVKADFLYDYFSPETLLQYLTGFSEKSLWIFGHNPTICDVLNFLTPRRFEGYPKCMVTCVSYKLSMIKEKSGKLDFIINPKSL